MDVVVDKTGNVVEAAIDPVRILTVRELQGKSSAGTSRNAQQQAEDAAAVASEDIARKAAVKEVQKWRFEPSRIDGMPVADCVKVVVRVGPGE